MFNAPYRPSGTVRNIASKFDQAVGEPQPQLTVRTNHDRYRKPVGGHKSQIPRSPQKLSPTRLQKRRPETPTKTPGTSLDGTSSFPSAGVVLSTRSQPHAAFSPKRQQRTPQSESYAVVRPLFGEITSDGRWNANFDLGKYGPLPTFPSSHRRSSDGSVALGATSTGLPPAMPQLASVASAPSGSGQKLSHKRGRSEMDIAHIERRPDQPPQPGSASPQYAIPLTPPSSGSRPEASRIPVSNRRLSADHAYPSNFHTRSASALSNQSQLSSTLPASPIRQRQTNSKEGVPQRSPPRSRYQHPPIPVTPKAQTLRAKIVPLPSKTSPPLRSSRPRQPVSQATTSASRARVAERLQNESAHKDRRAPSEQWLGKPYDPQKERSGRKIPELSKINFEERRARIQKAISANLEDSQSSEDLAKKSSSRRASRVSDVSSPQAEGAAAAGAQNSVDQHQAEVLDRETDAIPGAWPLQPDLTLDTSTAITEKSHLEREPNTAGTEFELDESPVLGRPNDERANDHTSHVDEMPVLLSAATYEPRHKPAIPAPTMTPITPVQETSEEEVQSPSVLDNVMQMRQASSSRGSDQTGLDEDDNNEPTTERAPSENQDYWGRSNGLTSVQGSIKIMLDEQAPRALDSTGFDGIEDVFDDGGKPYPKRAFIVNGYTTSPAENGDEDEYGEREQTPRKRVVKEDNTQEETVLSATNEEYPPGSVLANMLEQYRSTGTITAEMLEHMQKHMVDLERASINEGSNGFMIQSLLDSVASSQANPSREPSPTRSREVTVTPTPFEVGAVTPDTPTGWEFEQGHGTAIVFGTATEPVDEEEFHVRLEQAHRDWERQQRGEYLRLGAEEEDPAGPNPPPKDEGYTPRSSTGPDTPGLAIEFPEGLRISTAGRRSSLAARIHDSWDSQVLPGLDSTPKGPPRQPEHAPPVPPASSASASRTAISTADAPQMSATQSERGSSETSARARGAFWGRDVSASASSRPSTDSQRVPTGQSPLPDTVSLSSLNNLSFADSTTLTNSTPKKSMETGSSSRNRLDKSNSQPSEQKRLMKRRHIIKELLDTENTYHQDLKIIEDIYKGTASTELIPPDDKKTLFGNCDELERFSLHFYDELRRAVAPVYVPAKDKRWMNKRGSFSTTESGTGTSLTTPEGIDDERDRATNVGHAFLQNLQQMEHVYSYYLKNHDAANQRLAALRNTPTVKCWLDECHNNASDITSAWDLDSLLVKPTQRVAKYPMLLSQLLETTPQDHPDREAINAAATNSISMLTRINDAKKRADLVDQIVNRKRKDSDMRSGLAKAFGRRTEKLKERVGIAEAYQDTDFDELAHKFGGHYIRLQICMRDVQNYMSQIDKAVEHLNSYAAAIEFFADVGASTGSEQESKWRKYCLGIRGITTVAFTDHKNAVTKRVVNPMVACINLHKGPQNAINDRKKRIVDYAKRQAMEKRGEKPDKKTIADSDVYVALNDQLKLELPKLYGFTANLVHTCLSCFLDIQLTWYKTWERKLRPLLEPAEIPDSIQQIEPSWRAEFSQVKDSLTQLGVCNGSVLAATANFLSPIPAQDDWSMSSKRPTLDDSNRTMSVSNDSSPAPGISAYKRRSSNNGAAADVTQDGRMRSSSSMSAKNPPALTPGSVASSNRPWSSSNGATPTSSYNQGRPSTATAPSSSSHLPLRSSAEQNRSPRPNSGDTYFTARPDQRDENQFSNLFSSAMPNDSLEPPAPTSPRPATGSTPVLFVCASLFEFSIDKTRRDGGYPYLTYVQGEVFDVIAQKGELWLAKNQDDSQNSLGWIWEQHFVILSQD